MLTRRSVLLGALAAPLVVAEYEPGVILIDDPLWDVAAGRYRDFVVEPLAGQCGQFMDCVTWSAARGIITEWPECAAQ